MIISDSEPEYNKRFRAKFELIFQRFQFYTEACYTERNRKVQQKNMAHVLCLLLYTACFANWIKDLKDVRLNLWHLESQIIDRYWDVHWSRKIMGMQ